MAALIRRLEADLPAGELDWIRGSGPYRRQGSTGEIRAAPLRNIVRATTYRVADFEPGATMAHVMHRAGAFPSVTQARKNGWDRPIEPGTWRVGRRKATIRVVP